MQRLIFVLWSLHAACASAADVLPFPLAPLGPFALTYDSVKNQECKTHSLAYLKDLKEMKLWAIRMYDSSGKISSGLLKGNVMWLGDDKECLSASSNPGPHENNIRGKYCLGTIYVEPKSKEENHEDPKRSTLVEIYDSIHTYSPITNRYDESFGFFPSFSPLYIGLCVPHSCTPVDFEAALLEWLSPGNITDSMGLDLRVVVSSDSCITEDLRVMSTKAKLTLCFFALMTLIGIAGSVCDIKERRPISREVAKKEGVAKRIFLAFSFRRNLRLLFDTSTPMDEIGCLHGIRAIFCLDLYLLHKLISLLQSAIANREYIKYFAGGVVSMPLRAFWSQVDTFVVLSGLLTSYYATKRLQDGRGIKIVKMYIQRYVKFTPLFCVCVLWLENLAEYMFTESQFLRFGNFYVKNCKSAWFNILTYTNTFKGFNDMCYIPAHQLETDMHMYLLAPLLILFLWKMPKVAVSTLFGLLAYLSFLKYQVILNEKLATIMYYGISLSKFAKTADRLYLNVVHRLVPYLAGVLLGYYLSVRGEKKKLPKVLVLAGSGLALWCAHYSFLSMVHNSRSDYVYQVEEAAMYGALQPLCWSYAICWFIFICANGQAEWINQRLRWKGFLISSRLSFAFYLSQLAVMMIEIGRTPTPITFSPALLFDLNTFVNVILVTLWLTLLFLFPIGELWKIFTGEHDTVGRTKKEKGR